MRNNLFYSLPFNFKVSAPANFQHFKLIFSVFFLVCVYLLLGFVSGLKGAFNYILNAIF